MKKVTKHALLMSALSLLLCVSMLVGTTYAWFTDSVTSAGNKIKSGTLDIQLLMHDGTDYVDISNSDKPIFGSETSTAAQNVNADTLWEPGKTQVAYLAIKNNGDLALKYKVALDVYDIDEKELYKVMEYSIVPNAQPTSGAVTGWPTTAESKTVVPGINIVSGVNASQPDVSLEAGITHYFALAIHMKENAENKYQDGKIKFDLRILATQLEAESDSFDSKYDKDASYPVGKDTPVSLDPAGFDLAPTVTVPAEAPEGTYELAVDETKTKITNDAGKVTVDFDMTLLRDGIPVTNSGIKWPVTLKLPHPFVDVTAITHNGESIEVFDVNEAEQTVSFTTTHFSPFTIEYTDYTDPSFELEYDKNADGTYAITKGMFVGKNPADFDPSLKAADSEYRVTEFVKNDIVHYVISDKATTVVVDPSVSGKLYKTISDLKNNEHSTVLLQPGTYTEATTINVYSSMDIIGLGDAEDIKVVKGASNGSNRHLFNCNGSKAEYIQVTIRNMTLEVLVDNINNNKAQDNAAVQSIRKTKVKCYDLIVNKAPATTTWENAAFYINSNNAVDGVKYAAYLYVENTVVNSTNANYKHKVYATNGSKNYFYHSGLMYNDGTTLFTENSGSIKNTTMSAKDWWEQ